MLTSCVVCCMPEDGDLRCINMMMDHKQRLTTAHVNRLLTFLPQEMSEVFCKLLYKLITIIIVCIYKLTTCLFTTQIRISSEDENDNNTISFYAFKFTKSLCTFC